MVAFRGLGSGHPSGTDFPTILGGEGDVVSILITYKPVA